MIDNKAILITGGTGSFGRHFVNHVVKTSKPRRLVIFSRDELKQYEMQLQLSHEQYPFLRYFIGDVRDGARLEMAMRGIDYVIHAAALKQVPVAEYNPFECVHTNVLGAENVVQAAIRAGVKKVISLSTDKAASPINLYGATKLAADKIFVAANNLTGKQGAHFSVVRYGNVVGSRGSVIPLFRRAVERGDAYLPITDHRMTRFLITLSQGVEFVIESLFRMQGGEIFVPKIPSIKISDLAEVVGNGIPYKAIGVRPGEKLHETLITSDDARSTLDMDDHFVICPMFPFSDPEHEREWNGKIVAEDFSYSSNTNSEFLDQAGIKRLLEEAGC